MESPCVAAMDKYTKCITAGAVTMRLKYQTERAMKRLLLARHAKSNHGDPRRADRDRELNDRGRQDAPMMGRRLRKRGWLPELIVSSSARRALDTAKLMAVELEYPVVAIDVHDELYAASGDIWLETIHMLPADRACVMIVGHNPEITAVACGLTRSTIENVPTCGIVMLDFAGTRWDRVGERAPRAWDFDYPKRGQQS